MDVTPIIIFTNTRNERAVSTSKGKTNKGSAKTYDASPLRSPVRIRKVYNAISFGFHNTVAKHRKAPELSVGPGSYTLPPSNNSPSYSLGGRNDYTHLEDKLKARRRLNNTEPSYPKYIAQISFLNKSPCTKINPPHNKIEKAEDKASPVSYSPKLPDYSPKLTLGYRRVLSKDSSGPSPVTYRPDKSLKYIFPSIEKSIGRIWAIKDKAVGNPGPGAYTPKVLSKLIGPKYYLPFKKQRIEKSPNKAILLDEIKAKVKQSMVGTFAKAPRYSRHGDLGTPAPNAYQSLDLGNRRKMMLLDSCTFGLKLPSPSSLERTPGPGAYLPELSLKFTPKFAYTKASRPNLAAHKSTDMYYNLSSPNKGPKMAFSSAQRDFTLKQSPYPGPGSYEAVDCVGSVPEYALVKR
eukprot:TRINITY_DN5280_c0_g1_i9.p1 TRINITY_DN5280_c0_g1~~TRINITY_DN5280_c0_g1_i9.p1  ORF type:complete len:406 (+),score=34.01 TRINITY_DN5280_c0_g1_i9:274-1491(+)